MKYLDVVGRTAMARAFCTLILITPILLTSCKSKEKNSHGLSEQLILQGEAGIIPQMKLRKQYLEELQEETFGLTK